MEKHLGRVVLKHDDLFMIAHVGGSLLSGGETGLFWQGTRFLHVCELFLADQPLVALSHSVAPNGRECRIDLCNVAPPINQVAGLTQGAVYIRHHIELCGDRLIQTITVTSSHFGVDEVPLQLGLRFAADFVDLFEVRDGPRPKRGETYPLRIRETDALMSYLGLDALRRETQIAFTPVADDVASDSVSWQLHLRKGEPAEIRVTTMLHTEQQAVHTMIDTGGATQREHLSLSEVQTDDTWLNKLLNRGMHDFAMLCTATPHGLYPYGGIPWFSCPFGRDGLIASLQFLPLYPEVARGTLAFLAAYQGKKYDPFTEEAPGKIMHELRSGEIANCRELPFIPYYGTMDATLLFLIVFEAYIRWTNDIAFLEQYWPNVEAVAGWITNHGDIDGDGLVEYQSTSEKGLGNQGWKDSGDAISHADGRLATSPIALCEVQGYVFAGYKAMSYMAARLGKQTEALKWEQAAEQLQTLFLTRFWWPEEQLFYLALDGEKQPCQVVSSNAGQCLWTGIVPASYTEAIVARLMQSDMYSGWGIRTLSSTAVRYNPLAYHNGSIWCHDNALIGMGFARYGHKAEAEQLLRALQDVSQHYPDMRLPELFCGVERNGDYGPTFYPVACLPQAWATGAPFLLLSAMLGFQPDAEHQRLILHNPTLPAWLNKVELKRVPLGAQSVHLVFERSQNGLNVTQKGTSNVTIQIVGDTR